MRNNHKKKFDGFNTADISSTADLWVKNEKARYILKRWLNDSVSFEKIAEELDISARYCQELAYQYEMALYEHLGL